MIRPLALAATLLLSGCASHQGRPDGLQAQLTAPVQITLRRNLVYTPAGWPQPLTSDIYEPQGPGPFPAVIMIHGGGWARGSRDEMDEISRQVARHGYVVVNISYRLAPRWHFPAQLQDVQQAVAWVRANAAGLNVFQDRIATWGYSAGAHLAALAGVTGPKDKWFVEGTRVQAVVAGGTPVDIRYYRNANLTNGLTGVPYDENPDLWREASPLALVTSDDPPFFLYHGTLDFMVGENNSRAMYNALNAVAVPAELYRIRGLEHMTTLRIDAPVRRGIEFLDLRLRAESARTAVTE